MLCLCKLSDFQLTSWVFVNLKITGSISALEASRAVLNLGSDLFCIPNQFLGQIGILIQNHKLNASLPLLEALSQFNLDSKSLSIRPATIEDVEKSFLYSFSSRLSKRWHQVGVWLVDVYQNFLSIEGECSTVEAIRLEIRFSEHLKELSIWACNDAIQLFPVKPQDLVLNSDDLTNFMEDPDAVVHLQPGANKNRFYYLPRLGRGFLVSISRNLLSSSPFRSYGELWLYWQEQYGYNLPEEPEGIVYFNVTFSNDKTVYTYPSCCIFLKPPIVLRTSGESPTDHLRLFFEDLIPLVKCWCESRNLKISLIPRSSRIPWQEKLASEIQHAHNMSKTLKPIEGFEGRSKYFNDVLKQMPERSVRTDVQNNAPVQTRKKLVNSRITEYFSLRHPEIKVRRTASKVTFQPPQSSRKSNHFARSRTTDDNENKFTMRQLEGLDVMRLQKWMKDNGISFDPCDSQQGLILKVKKSMGL